jgi:putative 4-mercaptohistidine N1-methyltranferase
MNPGYESESILQTYLLFHYGEAEEQLPWAFGPKNALFYPVRCVHDFVPKLGRLRRALDLGCAVGRSSFELARFADEVIGIDLSQTFIEAAKDIQRQGRVTIKRIVEGQRHHLLTRQISHEIDRQKCSFEVGDALDLRSDLGQFDFVLAANLLDRVSDPRKLLETAASLTKPFGHFLLCSPYSWLPEFTPSDRWLGAQQTERADLPTWTALQEALQPAFALVKVIDLPFLISETVRKYQWSVAQASLWRKHSPSDEPANR